MNLLGSCTKSSLSRKQSHFTPLVHRSNIQNILPLWSIKEKMVLRGIREENIEQEMQDIAGLRVMDEQERHGGLYSLSARAAASQC